MRQQTDTKAFVKWRRKNHQNQCQRIVRFFFFFHFILIFSDFSAHIPIFNWNIFVVFTWLALIYSIFVDAKAEITQQNEEEKKQQTNQKRWIYWNGNCMFGVCQHIVLIMCIWFKAFKMASTLSITIVKMIRFHAMEFQRKRKFHRRSD